MSNTYKAVFTCASTGERVVWFVSSRTEAKRMLRQHTFTRSGEKLAKYRGNDCRFTINPIFCKDGDAGYDSSIMGWGGL